MATEASAASPTATPAMQVDDLANEMHKDSDSTSTNNSVMCGLVSFHKLGELLHQLGQSL